jgi:uncharacterized membrane protein
MSEITVTSLLFAAVGVVFIGIGVPLLRRQVKPNFWYGCRTQKTLSDEKIWYAVNRVTGRDLIVAGILLLTSSLAVSILGRTLNPTLAVIILLTVMVLSVAAMVVNSFRSQSRM